MAKPVATILSYGMGVESSAILLRWIMSPVVSAGIKQQHFRRFCSSKEPPQWRGCGTHST
jgi:hypothetical protein